MLNQAENACDNVKGAATIKHKLYIFCGNPLHVPMKQIVIERKKQWFNWIKVLKGNWRDFEKIRKFGYLKLSLHKKAHLMH